MEKLTLGTDEELISRCAKNDHAAFDILFKKYARPLTFFIEQIVHDHDRAEDIFQDTFLRVLRNISTYNRTFRFSTWIYRIALNLSINELRKRKRRSGRFYDGNGDGDSGRALEILDAIESGDNPYRDVEKTDMLDKVDRALNRLPAQKRIAFILKFYHNLSYDEIAEITDCTKGTVKSRIHYAVEDLQVLVGD